MLQAPRLLIINSKEDKSGCWPESVGGRRDMDDNTADLGLRGMAQWCGGFSCDGAVQHSVAQHAMTVDNSQPITGL